MPLEVPNHDHWFEERIGFPRPNWIAMDGWRRAFTPHSDRHEVWCQFVRHWLGRLCTALGGEYKVTESKHFQLLSELDAEGNARILKHFEESLARMNRVLNSYDGQSRGKFVALRLTEDDDFYDYVSDFFPDGESAGIGGCLITQDYYHMVLPETNPIDETRVRVHELAHNLLTHLPLPLWLNEALAMAFERDLTGNHQWELDSETIREHRAYWNASTIQEFWKGESFILVSGQKLAYSLAFTLLNIIYKEVRPSPEEFRRFIQRAGWHDAGAEAFREHLGLELCECVEAFLGPGDWVPRLSLAEEIRQAAKESKLRLPAEAFC